jgi:ABC-2 type transport system permease protein
MKITPGGVVAAEWTKFSSLRSTWITTGVSAFLLIAFGMIASASFSGSGMSAVDLALGGSTLAALAVGVLGVLLGAGEYTTGMIRSTFAAVPRRLPVLWSKSLVAGLAALVVMTIGAFVAFALGATVLNSAVTGLSLGDDGVLRALLGAGLYLGLVAVLGVALGMLVRSSAGAIAILAGGLLILPGLAPLLPNGIADAITPYLPSNAGSAVMTLTHGDGTLAPWTGLAVFALYVAATLAAAAYRLRKADA